jgi:hypothetical protein
VSAMAIGDPRPNAPGPSAPTLPLTIHIVSCGLSCPGGRPTPIGPGLSGFPLERVSANGSQRLNFQC